MMKWNGNWYFLEFFEIMQDLIQVDSAAQINFKSVYFQGK